MILTAICYAAVGLTAAKLVAALWLDALNKKSVLKHKDAVPAAFADFVNPQDYRETVAYTLEKNSFDMFDGVYNFAVTSLILLSGALPFLFGFFAGVFGLAAWAQALTLIGVSLVISLPELPLEWYSQFKIEERHGFNKSSFGLWVSDKLKGFGVSVLLGVPLLTLLFLFFDAFENTWWLWGFGAVALFQVMMIVIYPRFILPLFNKLEPLADGELKTRLFGVAERGGFAAASIQVMDGSRRSSHSNAYFTGLGRFRRIVLYDTLIAQLAVDELEAVLAHEIGHYKKGHIVRMVGLSFAMTFAAFAVMGWLSKSAWFFEGFGFAPDAGMGPLLLLFSMLSGLFTFWLTPLFNIFSRRNEYEADAFAKTLCGSDTPLVSALRKLHKKNRGNLTPHPVYSAFYYSHPTVLEREEALKKV